MEGMEIQIDSGGEIKAKSVAFDEEVRYRKTIGILSQHVTEMVQSNPQGCPAMLRIPFWPELLREFLTQMDVAFHRQIDEERKFLACGE
jgi:hypothetical protein